MLDPLNDRLAAMLDAGCSVSLKREPREITNGPLYRVTLKKPDGRSVTTFSTTPGRAICAIYRWHDPIFLGSDASERR